MKKTCMLTTLLLVLTLILVGCQENQSTEAPLTEETMEVAGTLFLKVNPEIAISYDGHGNVMSITSKNEDAKQIIEGYTDFEGRASKTVVKELVERIANEGYFVEEIESEQRRIVLEVEKGSRLPNDVFLDDVVEEIKVFIDNQDWSNH